MTERASWPNLVRALRLSRNETQGAFAAAMGVAQQTISRWEAGSQIPDLAIQHKLRQHLSIMALSSTAYWMYRVSHAYGQELLIDRGLTILAVSASAAAQMGLNNDQIVGKDLRDLLPPQAVRSSSDSEELANLVELGFFDGLIRSVTMSVFWSAEHAAAAGRLDIWPIVTTEQAILGYVQGYPKNKNEPPANRLLKIEDVNVRLNKD
ncbi:MAG TPA: hypothetical protein DCL54_02305 [Alphaproteobacteria bacterium]|nr:hypothetical protein [Alphaproteobacteria bacterium]HAJ45398.1 hypothetical protein [Alphaproteobacteria bacterium]